MTKFKFVQVLILLNAPFAVMVALQPKPVKPPLAEAYVVELTRDKRFTNEIVMSTSQYGRLILTNSVELESLPAGYTLLPGSNVAVTSNRAWIGTAWMGTNSTLISNGVWMNNVIQTNWIRVNPQTKQLQ